MSGIFGYIKTDNVNTNIDIFAMRAWNLAYGSDDVNIHKNDTFCLGCCRENFSKHILHINPVIQRDNIYAVIDALIFNREDLISLCQIENNISDEELLFDYITRYGFNALKDVNGNFSGAIYNSKSKTLTLFRDHLGVRPLYYYAGNDFAAFSTDIRGLLSLPQVDVAINEHWLYQTTNGYININSTSTEFANIFCVVPACYMEISIDNSILSINKSTYWKLGSKKIRFRSESEYFNRLKELITDAVKIRLDSVPGLVGAELSGGLDSGVIDILINRFDRDCIYFSWSVDPDELPYAPNDERLIIQDICKREGINCHYGKMSIDLSNDSNIAKSMKNADISLEEESPFLRFVFLPFVNTLPISEASQYINRHGARVVFSGHGGDEGVSHRCSPYEMFCHHEYYHFLRYMWSKTHGQKHRIITTLKNSYHLLKDTRKHLLKPFISVHKTAGLLSPKFSSKFSNKNMPVSNFAYDPIAYINSGGSRNRFENTALQGAYSGVRYLFPYLDYRVIDYAVSIPRYMYLRGRKNRYIFRETFKDILPSSLYKLQCKEDNSRKNMTEDEDWYIAFKKRKEYTLSILDREYWKDYLDFDFIDKWAKQERPSDEERMQHEDIYACLFRCTLIDNAIKKSKDLGRQS